MARLGAAVQASKARIGAGALGRVLAVAGNYRVGVIELQHFSRGLYIHLLHCDSPLKKIDSMGCAQSKIFSVMITCI